MSDPAIEAAQRAWVERYGEEMLPRFFDKADELVGAAAFVTAAAREALKPIRELHRKSPTYYLADDCETCSSDDGKVSEQHQRFESADGDWFCTAVIEGYCCRHCTALRSGGDDPVEWPCETAQLVCTAADLSWT